MEKIRNDQELLAHLRKFFKNDPGYHEYLDKIEQKKDFYELVEPGFLYRFPGKAEGLEEVFSAFEKGDEMLLRLREIYEACLDNEYSYFIPNPHPVSQDELQRLAKNWYDTIVQMTSACSKSYQSDFLDQLKNNQPAIELIKGEGPKRDPVNYPQLDGEIYDLEHEFMYALEDSENPVERFREAIYQMTCTYTVVYFVFWPLYQSQTTVTDPYRVFIELWKRRVKIALDEEKNVLKFFTPDLE